VTRECSRFALIRIPTRETRTLKTRRLLADKLGKGLSYSWYPPARDFCVISSQSFPAFYEPWLPSPAAKPPAGGRWLHEIKHDGFRMLVRRDAAGVRLFTRNGHDWTGRFPLIARAALSLKAASCLIDGEAVACDDNGLPVFDRLRYRRDDRRVFLYAFDLIELDGKDLRREPIERRKVLLIRLLANASVGLQANDPIVDPGAVVFRHACQLGFEGIVSKRLGSPYRSGRSPDWLKMKNPAAPAVKREAEEDWGEARRR
jgi:bifunctional non-homologous end joining protein LigD